MTLRETLLAVRAIVAEAPEAPAQCGCLEDAICRVITGKSWYGPGDPRQGALEYNPYRGELRTLPVYRVLAVQAGISDSQWNNDVLWKWNDHHSKTERIALVDSVINAL